MNIFGDLVVWGVGRLGLVVWGVGRLVVWGVGRLGSLGSWSFGRLGGAYQSGGQVFDNEFEKFNLKPVPLIGAKTCPPDCS